MGGAGRVLGTVAGAVGGFLLGGPAGAAAGIALGQQLGGAIDPKDPDKVAQRRQQEVARRIDRDAAAAEAEAIRGYQLYLQQGEAAAERFDELARSAREQPFVSDTVTMQGAEYAMRSGVASAQALSPFSPGLAAAIAARQSSQSQVDIFAKGAVSRMMEQIERERMVADLLKAGETFRMEGSLKYAEGLRSVGSNRRGVQTETLRNDLAWANYRNQRDSALAGAIGQGISTWVMSGG